MKKHNDVCAELEEENAKKKTVGGYLKTRKPPRNKITYTLRFVVTGAEVDVLKAALEMYLKNTTVKTKRYVAEDLLSLTKVQEKRQDETERI